METTDTIPAELFIILVPLAIWELAWKGFALWRAARASDKAWFITMLIINSAGILPIIYLLTHKRTESSS